MDWLNLGHATWLVQAAGLRLLFDPLLGPTHHGGVFEVVPRRALRPELLRPDFIFVSHRHPDHFDVPSLQRLLALDPDVVVVTPDPLVAWAAEALGARRVERVGAGQRIALDGLALVTTPSLAPDEWGAMVATGDGVAWNQVDTVLAGPDHVRQVVLSGLGALGGAALSLALVRWQPLLEVAAQLGHRVAFPLDDYAALLAQIAATGARALVPSAAGEAYAAEWSEMNARVYPVPEARLLRDLAALAPEIRGRPNLLGAAYRLRGGELLVEPDAAAELLTRLGDDPDPRRYGPLDLPPLRDRPRPDLAEDRLRADLDAWLRGPLARGLARACAGAPALRLVLELVFPAARERVTFRVERGEVRVEPGGDDDWDALNAVAATMLWEVIHARRHWGDLLLAGSLRALSRAYEPARGRLRPLPLGDIFLYHGLSYDESVRRAVVREVEDATRSAARDA